MQSTAKDILIDRPIYCRSTARGGWPSKPTELEHPMRMIGLWLLGVPVAGIILLKLFGMI